MDSLLMQILMFALPGGFFGSVVTWIISSRKRNNDFLAEMQHSIDLLSERYNKVLQENVTLRQEKADWLVAQQELLQKVDKLTREVENLRRNFNKKQKTDEIHNLEIRPPAHGGDADDERMRSDKKAEFLRKQIGAVAKPRITRRSPRSLLRSTLQHTQCGDAAVAKESAASGGDSGSEGGGDDPAE